MPIPTRSLGPASASLALLVGVARSAPLASMDSPTVNPAAVTRLEAETQTTARGPVSARWADFILKPISINC